MKSLHGWSQNVNIRLICSLVWAQSVSTGSSLYFPGQTHTQSTTAPLTLNGPLNFHLDYMWCGNLINQEKEFNSSSKILRLFCHHVTVRYSLSLESVREREKWEGKWSSLHIWPVCSFPVQLQIGSKPRVTGDLYACVRFCFSVFI